jgi:hypothetical protein
VSERQSQAPAEVIGAKGFINSARPVHLSHQNPRLIRLSCQTSLPIRLKSPKLFDQALEENLLDPIKAFVKIS